MSLYLAHREVKEDVLCLHTLEVIDLGENKCHQNLFLDPSLLIRSWFGRKTGDLKHDGGKTR